MIVLSDLVEKNCEVYKYAQPCVQRTRLCRARMSAGFSGQGHAPAMGEGRRRRAADAIVRQFIDRLGKGRKAEVPHDGRKGCPG